MRLRPEQLNQHLAQQLAPVYLICGDEPLLAQEAADAVRGAARQRGFGQRELFHADASFDWQILLNEANALSLFAEKKLLELRLDSGKPGDKGAKALIEYCQSPSPDNLLLIISGKLDSSALRGKWVKALEDAGALIQVWPVAAAQMPNWIAGRLREHGIRASRAAADILADRVEGNLLAAIQEIEKLKLLAPSGEVDATTMSTVVADSARYDVFALIDKTLEGDAASATRVLRGLREEGTEPLVILWALTRELRTLLQAAEARNFHDSVDAVFRKNKVWDKRQPLLKSALRRLRLAHLRMLLRQTAVVDRTVKGLHAGSPWDELTTLVMSFADAPPLAPQSVRLVIND
ncbi:MAG: DNA polymerase III subunit delta [Porticoccaceae bacterium]